MEIPPLGSWTRERSAAYSLPEQHPGLSAGSSIFRFASGLPASTSSGPRCHWRLFGTALAITSKLLLLAQLSVRGPIKHDEDGATILSRRSELTQKKKRQMNGAGQVGRWKILANLFDTKHMPRQCKGRTASMDRTNKRECICLGDGCVAQRATR